MYFCRPKVEPLISRRKERNDENKDKQHPIRTILYQAVTDIVANIERVRRFHVLFLLTDAEWHFRVKF